MDTGAAASKGLFVRYGGGSDELQFQRTPSSFSGAAEATPYKLNMGAPTDSFVVNSSGAVGIGSASPGVSLDMGTRTDALRVPNGNDTTDKTAITTPAAGMIRWNTTNSTLEVYNGTAWTNLATGSGGGSLSNITSISGSGALGISAGGTNQDLTLSASGSGVVTTGNNVTITSTTASGNFTNGALVVSGGVGVSGNINSDGAIAARVIRALISNSNAYQSSSVVSAAPLTAGPIVQSNNTGELDGTASVFELLVRNTATNAQRAYIGAVSNTGVGVHTPTIVIGQQTGANAYYERMRIDANGNVGVGTSSPRSALDVGGGSITARASVLNSTTTINFATGSLQHTNQNCQAYALHNMVDGGTYVFTVKGTTSTTCSFTAFSDAGSTALTVRMPPNHAATTATRHTVYNFMVQGGDVYVSWIPGY